MTSPLGPVLSTQQSQKMDISYKNQVLPKNEYSLSFIALNCLDSKTIFAFTITETFSCTKICTRATPLRTALSQSSYPPENSFDLVTSKFCVWIFLNKERILCEEHYKIFRTKNIALNGKTQNGHSKVKYLSL